MHMERARLPLSGDAQPFVNITRLTFARLDTPVILYLYYMRLRNCRRVWTTGESDAVDLSRVGGIGRLSSNTIALSTSGSIDESLARSVIYARIVARSGAMNRTDRTDRTERTERTS